jgi:DNA-binding transcriptional MocR family regulator
MIAMARTHRSKSSIGPDKLNQLRHVRFFRDMNGVRAHMRRHAAILRPKFDAVDAVLTRELGGRGLATWTRPTGGYFVSLDTPDGCARAVVKMAGEVGVALTAAGATFPYGRDPRDRNIRIAPSLPSLQDIEVAMEVLAVCVQRAALGLRA